MQRLRPVDVAARQSGWAGLRGLVLWLSLLWLEDVRMLDVMTSRDV
jgi:hypothetical protein